MTGALKAQTLGQIKQEFGLFIQSYNNAEVVMKKME